MDWDVVEDASGYAIYLDGVQVDTVTTNSHTLTGLTTATSYDVYVTSLNDQYQTESAPSETITFTTA